MEKQKTAKSHNKVMQNVAFFGSSDYSLPIVQTLIASPDMRLTLLVTKPNMEHYRQLLADSPIHLLTPTDVKGENSLLVQKTLRDLKIDIAIVADYGLIIPQEILTIPPYGFINIHFSDLPKNRGASPIQYTILGGEKQATFTFLEMKAQAQPEMDSGHILFSQSVNLNGNETTENLYRQLFELAAAKVTWVVSEYTKGTLTPQPQAHTKATFTTPSGQFDRTTLIKKEDAYIDSQMDAHYIERAVRAFTPWPKAWTTLGELFEIAKKFDPISKIRDGKDPQLRIQILSGQLKNDLFVPTIVQADGKKETFWKEFRNGYFE